MTMIDSTTLIGVKELAEHLGHSRQWIKKLKKEGRLPAPVADLAMGPVWTIAQFEGWELKKPEKSPPKG